jgi:hypothetical protein
MMATIRKDRFEAYRYQLVNNVKYGHIIVILSLQVEEMTLSLVPNRRRRTLRERRNTGHSSLLTVATQALTMSTPLSHIHIV